MNTKDGKKNPKWMEAEELLFSIYTFSKYFIICIICLIQKIDNEEGVQVLGIIYIWV